VQQGERGKGKKETRMKDLGREREDIKKGRKKKGKTEREKEEKRNIICS
jgi:hypothetical protein